MEPPDTNRIRPLCLPTLRRPPRSKPLWIAFPILQVPGRADSDPDAMGLKRQRTCPDPPLVRHYSARSHRNRPNRPTGDNTRCLPIPCRHQNKRNVRLRTSRMHHRQFPYQCSRKILRPHPPTPIHTPPNLKNRHLRPPLRPPLPFHLSQR